MEDTALLQDIFKGLSDVKLLVNPSSEQLKQVLRDFSNESFIALGHGTRYGLLNETLTGYVLTGEDADLLKDRDLCCIWCYASSFLRSNNLCGFCTSMFVSNPGELEWYGFKADSNVYLQVTLFCQRVHRLLLDNVPLSEWPDRLRAQVRTSDPEYVKFNYDGLEYCR